VVACLHRRMVRLHTHSLTYQVFARVVSRCLPCGFRLPECPSLMVSPNHTQCKRPLFGVSQEHDVVLRPLYRQMLTVKPSIKICDKDVTKDLITS